MIALDTNILVYAHRFEAPQNPTASDLVESLAKGSTHWAIPWHCLFEFYGVVTNPRLWDKKHSTSEAARAQLDVWLSSPSLLLLSETPDFIKTVYALLDAKNIVGGKIHDARIAALCLAHGVTELLTADRDFSLFPTLKTRNPFA